MREILFRGKRVDNGEWVFGCLIQCAITGKQYIFPAGSDANESEKVGEDGCLKLVTFEIIPETVGQYTGLTDKNGKRIFEGDVLGRKNYWDIVVEHQRIMPLNTVQYNNSKGTAIHAFDSSNWEVIGSIHDNPELLKGAAE